MVIVGWGSEGGNPYWLIANSHGINNNDKGHIKWGMRSSNPISRVYAVKVQLPSKCQSSRKCMNGGAFEDDCQCRCVPPYSGSTCSSCGLTCKNGGTRVSGKCACKCPVQNRAENIWLICKLSCLMLCSIFRLATLVTIALTIFLPSTSKQTRGMSCLVLSASYINIAGPPRSRSSGTSKSSTLARM